MSELRKRLDDAIPEPPETSGWASRAEAAASRRDRNRKAASAGVAALAVVAAGVTVPLLRPDDQPVAGVPVSGSPSASSSTPTITSVSELGCPSSFGNPSEEPAKLPTGAVAMRWCVDQSDSSWSTYAPPDVITEGIDGWVSDYNAQPTLEAGVCTSDASLPMGAVLLYPDGSTRTVSGMEAGCHTLGPRRGFITMRDKALELVAAQRAASGRPRVAAVPCKWSRSLIQPRLDEIESVAVCSRNPHRATMFTSEQSAVLIADLHENLRRKSVAGADGPSLQLFSSTGEFQWIEWNEAAQGWSVGGGNGYSKYLWQPGVEAQKILAPYIS